VTQDLPKNPMQPIVIDSEDVVRFKTNKIVYTVYKIAEAHGCGLNKITKQNFTQDDQKQFAQLLGYSVSGYGDLPYVDKVSVECADQQVALLLSGTPVVSEQEMELQVLRDENRRLKAAIRNAAVEAFSIHPDDLHE
jgi:Cys-tRNA synthase (O-phospho-L-seryl-tRNA:Cys-tRNA synthase)